MGKLVTPLVASPFTSAAHYAHDAGMARERDREQAQAEAWDADEAAQEERENGRVGFNEWDDPNG